MAMSLSGRIRWRSEKNWLGKERLVLQVQETGTRPENWGSFITMEPHTGWRDARSEDVSQWSIYSVGPNPQIVSNTPPANGG